MIGERLQEIRKDHGDTQQTLADKLNVSLYAVRCWEQGKSAPSHETLVAICRLYQVSADYLLGLSDDDPLYAQKRQQQSLSPENLALLRRFESFLLTEQSKPACAGGTPTKVRKARLAPRAQSWLFLNKKEVYPHALSETGRDQI